jgi:hypothetical protein
VVTSTTFVNSVVFCSSPFFLLAFGSAFPYHHPLRSGERSTFLLAVG